MREDLYSKGAGGRLVVRLPAGIVSATVVIFVENHIVSMLAYLILDNQYMHALLE